jgi:hypothetical protein
LGCCGDKFKFEGTVNGVRLEALIKVTGTLRYTFNAEAEGANLAGTKNPVPVTLTIGDDSGTATLKAKIGEEDSATRTNRRKS